MESDIKLEDHSIEILGDKVTTNVGFGGGTVELTGSNFKTSVSDVEMLFYGGRLRAHGGALELGSGDSGSFMGYSQGRDGRVQVTGTKFTALAEAIEIGHKAGNTFRGLTLSAAGLSCHAGSVIVVNPSAAVHDSQQRHALSHSSSDELLINANGHYQGGVKVEGALEVKGDTTFRTSVSMALGSKLLCATPDKVVTLPNGKSSKVRGTPLDVQQAIAQLQETVRQLQARVATLEAK